MPITSDVQVQSAESLFNGSGNVIQKILAANGDVDKALRTNATLPHDAWTAIDETLVKVAQRKLTGIADLQSRGLTRGPLGLGVMYDMWQTMSAMNTAEQSMSGLTQGAQNAPDFAETMIPIPITHIDFQIPLRKLLAMQQNKEPLDTTMIAQAAAKVIDKLEDTLFNGSTVVSAGRSLTGYLNYTDSVEVALSGAWTGTDANIEKDVVKLIAALEAKYHYGPYVLYLAAKEWNDLRQRDSYSNENYRDILLAMAGIEDVRFSGVIPAQSLCLVELAPETVDLSVGVDIKVVEWDTAGGMQSNFKVMAAMAPRIKSDSDGNCGIAYDNNMAGS